MNKQDFKTYIEGQISQVKTIKELCDNPIMSQEISYEQIINIPAVLEYLNKIYSDLEDKSLPSSYYTKIQHNIESLNISNWNEVESNMSRSYEMSRQLESFNIIDSLYNIYKFYRELGYFNQNITIVGANGSGKSSLALMLKETIDERDGIVIPAQKLLLIPTFSSIPSYEKAIQTYNTYQAEYFDVKTTYDSSDTPFTDLRKYSDEYKNVLINLISERNYIRNKYCDAALEQKNPNKDDLYSKLDEALAIWNLLIEHRTIFCDSNNNIKLKTHSGDEYPAYQMSDGEKLILFLVGRVLLAPPKAMIVIDEPEMYLHKAIVNKLWDKLEIERQDCLFVYLTHDLEFASTRNANKYWIESYKYPNDWKINSIPENEIPQALLMKLLGSQKKILFCEGKKNSLDTQIYECLFKQYTIISVQSCADVINYTRSYNKLPNKNSIAYGIIDRDFRVPEQLEKLEDENIYSFSVAEVENLFLIKEFILKYGEFKNETFEIKDITSKVLDFLDKNIEQQTSNYTSSYINYHFTESHVKKGNTKDELNTNYKSFKEHIKIEEWYETRSQSIKEIIASKDYEKAIMIYNNKGLHTIVENVLGMKSNTYRYKALSFLKKNEEAQNIFKEIFPSKITRD